MLLAERASEAQRAAAVQLREQGQRGNPRKRGKRSRDDMDQSED